MNGTHVKLRVLFEKILGPNYVMNNYYADSIINKLSNCSDPEITCLEKVPLISDLIVDALNKVDSYHITVKVFLIRMLAIVSHRELHFTKMYAKRGEDILKDFKDINSPIMNSSLRVAYTEVALSLVQHDSGVDWLLATNIWKEILSLCNNKTTVFVVRQTYKFASHFLWRLNDRADGNSIKLVLSYLLRILSDLDFLNLDAVSMEQEEEIARSFEPILHIILAVVTQDRRIQKSSLLIEILIRDFNILTHLQLALSRLRKEDLMLLIARTLFMLTLAKLYQGKPYEEGVVYDMDDFMALGVMFFNTIYIFIQRRSPILVLDYCNACNTYRNMFFTSTNVLPATWISSPDKVDLQFQILFLFMVPSLLYVKTRRTCQLTNEGLDETLYKMFHSSCEHTSRAAYALRDLVMDLDITSVTLASVKRLACLENHLSNVQANLVFQILYYVLAQYDPVDVTTGEIRVDDNYETTQEEAQVMTYVLSTVSSIVKNYKINWSESIEIICLYSVVYNILKRPNLSSKFVVTALNVIALTVKKFLQPNLSLLVQSKPGSPMHALGKLIYMKMHDLSWEVRDSALELLYVCTEISNIKFPPYQRQILENNLINVAATIALNDHEYYVRVSALRCLGVASKVHNLWDQLVMQYPKIQEQLVEMMCNNQEGVVRKEACAVLCYLYQNNKLSNDFKPTLYQHMVSSALCDFHWEVQLTALKFWKKVIQSCLTDQGMLDGTFPPVTFSRETRKIVSLTKTQIQRRLIKILDELSNMGCLTVLVQLLNEDCEIDVMDSAFSISMYLMDILDKYEVPDNLVLKDGDPESVEDLISDINDVFNADELMTEPEDIIKSDTIIDGILDVDDVQLLANIYENHLNIQNNKKPELEVKPKIQLKKFSSPYLFVKHLKSKNFKTIVEEKKKWKEGIRSLQSLLDDVIGMYDIKDDTNSLDCY